MNWLDRCLVPRSKLVNFVVVAFFSVALSCLLIGSQIFRANWGIIDDHEVFFFLGPSLDLPVGDIWATLLAKTEVGTLQGRFRPSFYLLKVIETSLFGANVHLWYLSNAIAFAIFLGSIWWVLRPFVGGWLSGAITGSISLLPMWSDVWSRLGPSEIYGAACVGIMIFAANSILLDDNHRVRNLSAIALALATIVLVGLKETFIPLAAGSFVILILAGIKRRLPLPLIGVVALLIVVCLGGIGLVVIRQMRAAGTDFYGNAAGPWLTIKFGIMGVVDALRKTWWLFAFRIIVFWTFGLLRGKPAGSWIPESKDAVAAYGFIIAMYAAQCALYRSTFPQNSRYDFPAMLLVPIACCILVGEICQKARRELSERTVEYAQLTVAGFLFLTLTVHLARVPPLVAAVKMNIKVTNRFHDELLRLVRAAKESPESPVILDAYGPVAYEPVYSLLRYIPALGAKNIISVRFHPDKNISGPFYDALQQRLSNLQQASTEGLTPLLTVLNDRALGCLSVGIDGAPDAACSGFEMQVRP